MKKQQQNPDELKKLYLVLQLPFKEIAPIIEKIKQHKRFEYYWINNLPKGE